MLPPFLLLSVKVGLQKNQQEPTNYQESDHSLFSHEMASEEDMLHQGQLQPLCFASIIVNAIFVQYSLHVNRGCYHPEARHAPHEWLGMGEDSLSPLVPQKARAFLLHEISFSSWTQKARPLSCPAASAVIYEPLWHSGRLCYWWVWGTFHVRFYTLHKLLLRVSLGLPCHGFTISLLELMMSSCLLWIDFYDTGTKS